MFFRATEHGDMAKECAPAYLLYGKCNLEMARLNLGVVDPESAKAKGTEGSDDRKMDDIKEEDDTAGTSSAEAEKTDEKPENTESANQNDEANEKDEENSEPKEDGNLDEEVDDEEGGDDEEGDEGEEEEDGDDADSYLKVAWTMLDLAKVIFLKEKTTEGDLSASDCLMSLGEVFTFTLKLYLLTFLSSGQYGGWK